MTSLFERKPIIPKIMKEMGIYGDYILEVRGDEQSQKEIIEVTKCRNHSVYCDVITHMRNWNYTRLGNAWWGNNRRKFASLMQSKYEKNR